MPRIIKDYDKRYKEFLETGYKLFFTTGYETTSVQSIIDAMDVSKGAFYHYFDSKTHLLEAVVNHLFEERLPHIQALVDHNILSVTEKLEQFFSLIENWKLENKALMLSSIRVLYLDENVLLRSKMLDRSQQVIAPLLAQIIEQGITENILTVDYPLATSKMILKMSETISQTTIPVLITEEINSEDIEQIKQQIIVFNQSVGLLLGLEKDGIELIEPNTIDYWLT